MSGLCLPCLAKFCSTPNELARMGQERDRHTERGVGADQTDKQRSKDYEKDSEVFPLNYFLSPLLRVSSSCSEGCAKKG